MAYLSSLSISDIQTGFSQRIFPLLGLKTVEMTREGGSLFGGTILDTSRHILSGSAGGTGSVSNGFLNLSVTTASNSYAIIQSSHPFRYITGRTQVGTFTGYLADTGSAGNIRRFGFYTSSDGFFFILSGSTPGVGVRKGGVDTLILNGNFNGSLGSSFPIMINAQTQYEIYYTSLNVYWLINGSLLHKIEYPTSSLSNILTLPFTAENINSGSTVSSSIFARAWVVETAGDGEITSDYYHNSGSAETRVLKYGPGKLETIIVNQKGAGGNTATFYDNISGSGQILAVVDVVNLLGEINYGITFYTGLTYTLASANSDITIVWN